MGSFVPINIDLLPMWQNIDLNKKKYETGNFGPLDIVILPKNEKNIEKYRKRHFLRKWVFVPMDIVSLP